MQKTTDLLDKINEQYTIKKSSFINEFLWSCAGVNKKLLRQCPNDYAKYTGIGGTILFTALMAAFSGGYALYFVFNSIIIAMLFGIFWGTLIFNLDRFIINSMQVDEMDNKLTWKKLKIQLPRLIMAVFLGIVIATPLEMRIFSDRIESQLLKDNIEHVNAAKNISEDYKQLQILQKEESKLLADRKILNDKLLQAQADLKDEAEGNALSGQAGHGTIYKDKQDYANNCQNALNNWDAHNKNQLAQLESRISQLNKSVSRFESNVDKLQEDGFIARYEAFSNLKNSNNTLYIMSLLITLLFIIIEIIPTFFKLVMPACMYTELLSQYDSILQKLYQTQNNNISAMLDNITNSTEDNNTINDSSDSDSIIYGNSTNLNTYINNTQYNNDIDNIQAELLNHNTTINDITASINILNSKLSEISDLVHNNDQYVTIYSHLNNLGSIIENIQNDVKNNKDKISQELNAINQTIAQNKLQNANQINGIIDVLKLLNHNVDIYNVNGTI